MPTREQTYAKVPPLENSTGNTTMDETHPECKRKIDIDNITHILT